MRGPFDLTFAGAAAAFCLASPADAALVVSKAPSTNMHCDGNGCVATAADAVMNVNDLKLFLRAGNTSLGTANVTDDIVIDTPLSWANTHRLTFVAAHSIVIRKPIVVEGHGGLTLQDSADGQGTGTIAYGPKGRIDFWDTHAGLTIDNQSYALAADVHGLEGTLSGRFLALTKDYDAAQDGTYQQAPVASFDFGVFDGLGHTISNLKIVDTAGSDNVGLFGSVDGSELKNIGLVDADVTGGDRAIVGALAGQSGGVARNVFATGSVHGGQSTVAGGLFGQINGGQDFALPIQDSWSAVSVTADQNSVAGGFAGATQQNVQLLRCHASGTVSLLAASTLSALGGLVGAGSGELQYSYATGAVTGGDGAHAGGLVGENGFTIWRSYAGGAVTGGADARVGGLVGEANSTVEIQQSYATGAVAGGDGAHAGGLFGNDWLATVRDTYATGAVAAGANGAAGGLAGEQNQVLSRSYSRGTVSGGAGSVVGGLIGNDFAHHRVSRTYWDTDTSGIADPSQGAGNHKNANGITAMTSAELQAALPDGFSPSIWRIDPQINGGLPFLRHLPPN
ncbi:MAG TPA: hypothetical protein VG889_19005 [Rhizomicrobium sp.]|nr:hypothetical protein [Rhizomicrobium sp.]